MIEFLLGGAVGLVVGWVFLPEPAFVRQFFDRIGWSRPTAPTTTPTV